MNKKLPRLFQPSMRLYFMLLIAFAVSTFFIGEYNRILAGIQIFVLICLVLYSNFASRKRNARLLSYLESMSDSMDLTVRDTPLPVVVYNSNTGEIIWSNDRFIAMTELKQPFFDLNISDIAPDFTWDWLLSGRSEGTDPVPVKDRFFWVYGSMSITERDYIATTYWVDVTEYVRINKEYLNSRPVFAILTLDNYEELLKGVSEKVRSGILSDVDEKIRAWAGEKDGYLCKYDRNRYFFMFEERHLEALVNEKFSILDSVRSNIGADGVHATLSIGLGKDGDTPIDNFRFASLSVEMALSRGGDQAVIRNRSGFEFYGGRSPQFEKRTKVKSRIMANAFGELLLDASAVFIMSHTFADYDSVGAAIGICCIARTKRKKARIVIDMDNNLAQNIIDTFMQLPEYEDVFISEQEAILEADSRALLVVVDTSRPDKVQSESLLMSCTRIAVIDHHRRAAAHINNAVLNFNEPSASSTAELVTEIIQYLVEREGIMRLEAEALLAGIVLDTKGFSINTGSATFDAAAFLRRMGADSGSVKKFLQSDLETATARYTLMHDATIYRDGIAIAMSNDTYSRISIAQAADELLNIKGVHTSFVAANIGGDVFASGRSIGGVNVQLVMEKLGGGGSQSTAGLQVRGASVEQVMLDLKNAIDVYYSE